MGPKYSVLMFPQYDHAEYHNLFPYWMLPYMYNIVKPSKGKALLWPSVMDDNLEAQDYRTNHEARAVIKGKKFAANTWIHLYDFENSNLWGCTGTFDQI